MATPQERKFAFSYVERGKQFVAAKQYPEALEALREAVRRDPAMVEAWILLALTHYRFMNMANALARRKRRSSMILPAAQDGIFVARLC